MVDHKLDSTPAVVTVESPERLVLLGDVHGRWEALTSLLSAAEVARGDRWAASPSSVLVQVGDLIDGGEFAGDTQWGATGPGGVLGDALSRKIGEMDAAEAADVANVVNPPRSWPDARIERSRKDLVAALRSLLCVELMRELSQQTDRSSARVVCLRGNHEQDLLTGRFVWTPEQKQYLLKLAGLTLDEIQALIGVDIDGRPALIRDLSTRCPLVAWVASLPVLARVGSVCVVHGGPNQRLLRRLAPGRIDNLERLSTLLQGALDAGPDHPLWAEGKSILSPDRAEDDLLTNPQGLLRFLQVVGADLLAVGHSPFVGLEKGVWYDTSDPDVQRHLYAVNRFGPNGRLLKLDCDLKRSGPGGIVCMDHVRNAFDAIDHLGGRRSLLRPSERLSSLGGGRSQLNADIASLQREQGAASHTGVSDTDYSQILELLDQLERRGLCPEGAGARATLFLRAKASDLQLVIDALSGLLVYDRTSYQQMLQAADRIEATVDTIARRILAEQPQGTGGALWFALDQDEQLLDSMVCDLHAPVADRLQELDSAWGPTGRPVVFVLSVAHRDAMRFELHIQLPTSDGEALELCSLLDETDEDDQQQTAVATKLSQHHARLLEHDPASLPGDLGRALAQLKTLPPAPVVQTDSRLPAPKNEVDASTAGVVRLLVGENRAALGQLSDEQIAVAKVVPARERDGKVWRRLDFTIGNQVFEAASLPSGHLLLVNNSYYALGMSLTLIGPDQQLIGDHGQFLLRFCQGQQVSLYCGVREEVASLLERGQLQALGSDTFGRSVPWTKGAYLFTTPRLELAELFLGPSGKLWHVAIPKEELGELVRRRLLQVNLMRLALGPIREPTWGSLDLDIEVVACGVEGVEELMRFRVPQPIGEIRWVFNADLIDPQA